MTNDKLKLTKLFIHPIPDGDSIYLQMTGLSDDGFVYSYNPVVKCWDSITMVIGTPEIHAEYAEKAKKARDEMHQEFGMKVVQ